jgi:hypothetical protein
MTGLWGEILTRDLPNTKQECEVLNVTLYIITDQFSFAQVYETLNKYTDSV